MEYCEIILFVRTTLPSLIILIFVRINNVKNNCPVLTKTSFEINIHNLLILSIYRRVIVNELLKQLCRHGYTIIVSRKFKSYLRNVIKLMKFRLTPYNMALSRQRRSLFAVKVRII